MRIHYRGAAHRLLSILDRLSTVAPTTALEYGIHKMPDYPHIEAYYAKLDELIQFGGSDNEQSIRPAFLNCLSAYCQDQREKLVLVPELQAQNGTIPDGTIKDSMRLDRGYWEAKDTHDNLDQEIQRKFNRGYPRDNIIFEDSKTSVLIQNQEEAMRVDMRNPSQLHRLIRAFLSFVRPEVAEFRKALKQFKDDPSQYSRGAPSGYKRSSRQRRLSEGFLKLSGALSSNYRPTSL